MAIPRWRAALLAVAACARAASTPAGHEPGSGGDAPELRLPRDVRPVRYALELTVDPERAGFEGKVAIDVELARPWRGGDAMWLHALDLDVRRASIEQRGAAADAAFAQVTRDGVARLAPARPLAAGPATLRLEFAGRWNDRVAGLYRERVAGAPHPVRP